MVSGFVPFPVGLIRVSYVWVRVCVCLGVVVAVHGNSLAWVPLSVSVSVIPHLGTSLPGLILSCIGLP